MNNKLKRSIAVLVCTVMLGTLFAGCGKTEEPAASSEPGTQTSAPVEKTQITFWHFNKDEGPKIVDAFQKANPNVEVKLTIVPDKDQEFQNKLTQALQSGGAVPDVFPAESAFVKRFVEMKDAWLDITDKATPLTSEMVPYTIEVGKDKSGKIRALSHQATPGGVGFKLAAAKQYLGTDDAAKISEMIATPEKIIETSKLISEKSGGKVKLFAGAQELKKIYLGGRADGWVKDGKLVIDPKVTELVDLTKKLREGNLEGKLEQWSTEWAASIAADDKAMCYCVPTWGVPWIIGSNDAKAKDGGRWGVAKSPCTYFWGGTWFGIYSKSTKVDAAWSFVKFFTADKNNLKTWAKDNQDFANNTALIKEGATGTDKSSIIGASTYAVFEPVLSSINGKILTTYDDAIEKTFDDLLKTYLAGTIKTKDEFMKKFKDSVKANVKDITVE